jgi:hypothetical protein
MNSRKPVKQVELTTTEDVQVVQDLQVGKHTTTTKEKISAYFTIAAAAFGLISDGCRLPKDTTVCSGLMTQKLLRSEQSYDHD